ncbi:MAG TPA: hypothetical protein VIT65_17910 [Microlunatus sp.]
MPTRGPADARKGGIADVICGDCGETNKPGTEFCLFCGAYLGWEAQEKPAGANDVTEVQPVQPPAPAQVPTTRATQGTAPAAPVLAQPVRPLPTVRPVPPPENAAHPEPARSAPQPSPVTSVMAPVPPPQPSGCPTCGRAIDPSRRFCGHCGEQFIWPGTSAPVTRSTKRSTWWTRLWDSKDRVARRAYRRSLPPLYRWRRVIIAILALGLIGAGLTVVDRSPKAFVLARYYDLRNVRVPVPGMTAEIIPPEASVPETTPDALVDGTAKAWQMAWTTATQGSPCRVTPTTAVIQLSFARTRIREIDLRAGLLENNPNRLLQFRPQKIWIAYADQCQDRDLKNVERQPVSIDTELPVDSIRIGVQSAFPPDQPTGQQEVLSFTEITLLSRPPVR